LTEIDAIVNKIVRKYWIGYAPYLIENYILRHVFEVGLLVKSLGGAKGKVVADVGGGWGAFAASCSALGMKTILIDDFGDAGMSNSEDPRHCLAKDYGVSVVSRDAVGKGLGLAPGSVDAVTSFDMIEHLHASPREFLRESVNALHANGVLLLGAPNCVNLRKRITVPLGRGQWSDFSDWYGCEIFRGHVREPDVEDLKKIVQDLRLSEYRILGRNWLGLGGSSRLVRVAAGIGDRILRFWPSLCSNIYLVGWKR
jgi:hypothetical protein